MQIDQLVKEVDADNDGEISYSEFEKINSLSSPFIAWMPTNWDAGCGFLCFDLSLKQAIWRYHILGHKTYTYGVVPKNYHLAKRLLSGKPLPCLLTLNCAKCQAKSDSAGSGMYDTSDESGSDY